MKPFKKLYAFILALVLCFGLFNFTVSAFTKDTTPSGNYIVSDTNSTNPLPSRFRIDPSLGISGSAEFTPLQLPVMKTQINNPNIIIVDLRQESHGYINNAAIAFYNPKEYINNGMDSKQVMESEKAMLATIPLNKEVPIYHRKGTLKSKVFVYTVNSESKVAADNGIGYVRVPVTDTYIPSPQVVDQFVEFVKGLKPGTHLHFHCLAGQGRTTSFMAMYNMLRNDDNLSLDKILARQIQIGGIELMTSPVRNDFIKDFYKYSVENKANGYKVPYSKWTKLPFKLASNNPPQ
ncbi:MAG: phosphatase [Clostridium sp.]|uniref:phosphatase domain-containing putative toxin n=1 Tax=Clostridium sp. TaxID=1506 RepID=UPI002FCB55C9